MNELKYLIAIVIIGFIGIATIYIGGGYLMSKSACHNTYIQSEHLITPEIKLRIKDNKVDTTYIYRK